MTQNPRARLFVLFLDTYHVDVAASHNIREAAGGSAGSRDRRRRSRGGHDAGDVGDRHHVRAQETTTIDGMLTRYWHWGERDRMIPPDPEDEAYGTAFQIADAAIGCSDQNGIAAEMIDRRHEKRAIDALQDLVRYLARRPRRAEGDSGDHQWMAAVPARTARSRGRSSVTASRPGRRLESTLGPASSRRKTSRWRQPPIRSARSTDQPRADRRRRRSSAICSTRRTRRTRRSTRWTRAAWRSSTHQSCELDVPVALRR